MTRPRSFPGCQEFRQSLAAGRRDFLRVGVLGAGAAWGLSLPSLLRAQEAAERQGAATDKQTSVIILWMRGGPSHIDMWDMKPQAPAEYRGEFSPISTAVPDIQICELLPKTAAVMDKWSIVRSLHGGGHSSGDQLCFTGYEAGSNKDVNIYPSVGSIVARQTQHLDRSLPAYVMVPRMVPGTDSAYLGPAWRPFETQADPASDSSFNVPNLALPDGLSVRRLGDRRTLLGQLDAARRDLDADGTIEAMDKYQQQAWGIVTSDKARRAFDLDSEPAEVRERYGFFEPYKSRVRAGGGAPNWPQRILLARRLVEAGVRLVTVDCRWWDTHDDNFWALRTGFLPRWDQAYSALIEDLDQRGLLDSTMVVAWGEMGRTPRINYSAGAKYPGRNHWPEAMSAALAGGGIQGGRTVGSTTARAERPKHNPKSPQDVLATIYRHLGVDTKQHYTDHAGRPHPVLPFGDPIDELFA